jgi:hypothetical protein
MVEGAYKMDNGEIARELMLPVVAGVDDPAPLEYIAARAARLFKQETVYFETVKCQVDFIRG